MLIVKIDPRKWLRRIRTVGYVDTKSGPEKMVYNPKLRTSSTGRQCCLGFFYRQLCGYEAGQIEGISFMPAGGREKAANAFFGSSTPRDSQRAFNLLSDLAAINDQEGLSDQQRINKLNNELESQGAQVRFKLVEEE